MTTTIEVTGARGGQGTTTIAAALALLHAGHGPTTLVSAEPASAAVVLGLPFAPAEEWAQPATNLHLEPCLPASHDSAAYRDGAVVIDRGSYHVTASRPPPTVDGARRYVVLRGPCYVALATLLGGAGGPFDGVIIVAEEGRSLTAKDVHDVLGIPVVATLNHTPRVARTIDAGLLVSRLHRLREFHQLRALAEPPAAPNRAQPKSHTDLLLPKIGKSGARRTCRGRPSQPHVCGTCEITTLPPRSMNLLRQSPPRRTRGGHDMPVRRGQDEKPPASEK